jgi:shikimate 5-dehydrogenase
MGAGFRALSVLGLKQAAVTSPLKEVAFHSSKEKTGEAELLRSVNTLYYNSNQKRWAGHNTDFAGFQELAEGVDEKSTVVLWGGGGTLNMMKKVLPHSYCFSATRGEVREEDQTRWKNEMMPDVLVWAAPRKGDMKWPNTDWKPKLVIDLNYTDDSAGREYAQRVGAEYRSGVKMFRTQAQHQREFWEIQP